jgi:hypothetical protein
MIMARLIGCPVLFLLAPALILGQNPRKSAKPIPATPAERAQLGTLSEVLGKLARVDTASSGNKTLALDVLYHYLIPKKTSTAGANPPSGLRPGRHTNFQSQLAGLQQQYRQALNTKNPATREQRLARIMMRMQQLQAQMVMQQLQLQQQMIAQANRAFGRMVKNAPAIGTGYKEFNMEAVENVVVRRLNPPTEYDNKGNLKTYSKDELERLRGKDKTLPGYEASLPDLRNGQMVKVYFSQAKTAKKEKKDDKNANDPENDDAPAAGKDKKAANAPAPAALPPVRMILILVEPTERDG